MGTGRKAQSHTADSGYLAQSDTLLQLILQVLHLGLAARTGAATRTIVGALFYLQGDFILLGNAAAHFFKLVAYGSSPAHAIIITVLAAKVHNTLGI